MLQRVEKDKGRALGLQQAFMLGRQKQKWGEMMG